jgi:hypothetical protein
MGILLIVSTFLSILNEVCKLNVKLSYLGSLFNFTNFLTDLENKTLYLDVSKKFWSEFRFCSCDLIFTRYTHGVS